jgi:hypothetical protein
MVLLRRMEVGAVRHDPTSVPPAHLREIVEAALKVAIFETSAGRDAVLMLLRPELAAAIPRMPTTKMDTMSIVANCARYPDGLAELIEAVRFYAEGALGMAHLDAILAGQSTDGR